jgi:hypothetical protein
MPPGGKKIKSIEAGSAKKCEKDEQVVVVSLIASRTKQNVLTEP